MSNLTHLSLFSGIGGLDLAAEAAGFQSVGQCEWADYATKVLEKHWPDVPRWRDIRTLTGDDFYGRTGLRTVDVISGGFPCQPFSLAGKQKGKDDDRYLWPEMLRVIREIAPAWVLGENVPGILRLAAGRVVQDLEREGYNVVVLDFEAAAVGAPHRRERIAFVANRSSPGRGGLAGARSSQIKEGSRHSLTLSHAVLLPTPTASEAEHGGPNSKYGNGSMRLTGAAMLWRTPCAQDGGGRAGYADSAKLRAYIERGHQPYLTDIVKHPDMTPSCADVKSAGASSGQLNPTWVEWLMGFPIGWTDLDA